ncbi:CopD family protein [Rhodoferax aquaticus]|uniref:Copper resistance protein D domain-containing protein n=1 Tax=Rhodoferax aquaticus TaxID=2527691 RepID=A0A515EJG5_9BURK|nr:CopD family protein [Rhodoferax aquaticus]QDL52770.1 hypothetical protein EXZ61_00475 [Rhodoferax aquaticus]
MTQNLPRPLSALHTDLPSHGPQCPPSACCIGQHPSPNPEPYLMYDILKLLHLIAAIVWMGGMTFMLLALRPATLAVMEPQPRARLMAQVWQRFFNVVLIAVVVVLATGGHLYAGAAKAAHASGNGLPLGWNLMAAFGLLMVLVFGHIRFAGFKKFQRAVAASEWPVAAAAAATIHKLVVLNFVLGWLAIGAVRLLR